MWIRKEQLKPTSFRRCLRRVNMESSSSLLSLVPTPSLSSTGTSMSRGREVSTSPPSVSAFVSCMLSFRLRIERMLSTLSNSQAVTCGQEGGGRTGTMTQSLSPVRANRSCGSFCRRWANGVAEVSGCEHRRRLSLASIDCHARRPWPDSDGGISSSSVTCTHSKFLSECLR